MSDISDYNEALAAAKLKALRVLRELLANATDPTERRRIAQALLRIRVPKTEPKAPAMPSHEPQPAPAPAKALPAHPAHPAPPAPPLSPHALGTLHLDTQSLSILTGASRSIPAGAAPIPIRLTPSDEPPIGGGPASLRPLPIPLGPARA